ncbi:MAG: excinuclease ABC subunit UvrC [Erysipelotrichia bacterium]|nr:excinuclease ABC subunit UvrC [Erysipelotrichia bacterium]
MLKDKLLTLPNNPGCYLMKDKNNEIIYVGKAKNLKNRVNSYFHGQHNNKTTKLVSNIVDFEYIVTPSEKEAFILEYNLIKKYKPRFNIIFMDDCSYPYLRLTTEQYPTLQLVRDRKKMKNARYFGPYPNVGYAKQLLSLLQNLFPLRKCKVMPAKVCLYYHIGNCLGPCEFKIEPDVYRKMSEDIIAFLNGDTKNIKEDLIAKRDKYAENLSFEKAEECQKLIEAIEHVTAADFMQFSSEKSCDVFNYYQDKGYISIVGLLYRNGKLLSRHLTLKPLYDSEQETFISYLIQYYQSNPLPKELILPYELSEENLQEIFDCHLFFPQKGDKLKLLNLAQDNCKVNLQQKFEIVNKQQQTSQIALAQLHKLINWPVDKIELFDNSHISGTNAVAAQVVYVDGKPEKKSYRLYKVSNGNNDFANMEEVIYRRLFNALQHKSSLPDLIIVDGGESQIKAAKTILEQLNISSVKLLGLVKNDKHQTDNLMDENFKIIPLDKESELFYLLTNMQDEVHRSAISFHQRLRQKEMQHSQLEEIDGIGPKKRSKLLHKFSSVKKIKDASIDELSAVVGSKAAQNVYEYFRKEKEND